MSFPPERHVLRDLGFTAQQASPGRSLAVVPPAPGVRGRGGLPAVGALGVVADSVATMAVLPVLLPDWTATADLGLHLSGSTVSGALLVDAEVLRAGSRLVVVRVTVSDGGEGDPDTLLDDVIAAPERVAAADRVGVGLLTFVRMPSERSLAAMDADKIGTRSAVTGALWSEDAIEERVGVVRSGEPGEISVPSSDYVRNSMGAISGGVHVIAAQAAAESARPHLVATGVDVCFLSAARVGPIRATATPVRDASDHAVASVDVVDDGTGKLVSTATVVLGAVDHGDGG